MKGKTRFSVSMILISMVAAAFVQANDEETDSIEVIDVEAAAEFVTQHEDAVILDVRTPIEYDMSHITDSINIDVQDESFQDVVASLDPDKIYIVHCTKNPVGGRSSRALEQLQSLGFANLYSLEGGYVAWKDADLPLTKNSN